VGFILCESRSQRDGVSLRDGDVFKLVDYHKKPFGFTCEELVTSSCNIHTDEESIYEGIETVLISYGL
jgi:hypothetical protein